MNPVYNQNIPVELEHLKPLGDFVLVKRLPDHDKQGRIWLPGNRKNPELGLRRGVVVACGPGDKIPGEIVYSGMPPELPVAEFKRAPMHIKPGDTIVYTRAPANDLQLNGEEYTMLHEEQHIYAVLESEAA